MHTSVSSIGHPNQRRYLALWFPFLETDRLHRLRSIQRFAERDERPLVVVERTRGSLRLAAIDPSAIKLGLRRGSTLADARARVPDIAVAELDERSDAELLNRLALHCDRYTPLVALDPPNGLMLDISGCAHLFGGEEGLRARVISHIERMGLQVRATVAGTPEAARALSRFSILPIAPSGGEEALVRRLPIMAIAGLSSDTVTALSRAGLKTIGAVADRPFEALAARFGQGLITRLVRTLGREDIRITPIRPLADIVIDRHFTEPLTQLDALEDVLAILLDAAATALQAHDHGGRIFIASLYRSDGEIRQLTVETGRPSRDVSLLRSLYRERMATLAEPIDAGFGFDAVRLTIPLTEPLSPQQPCLDGRMSSQADDAVDDLVDRLVVRFGHDRVLRFKACNSHIPEHAGRLMPAGSVKAEKPSSTTVFAPREADVPPARPLQMFDPPQRIDAIAEVPDGPPLRFRWRRILHEVAHTEGPERIAPEWWHATAAAAPRDYYRVEDTTGHRFWIFRRGDYGQTETPPRWFIHGLFA